METNGSNEPTIVQNMDTTSATAINTAETNTNPADKNGLKEQPQVTIKEEAPGTWTNTDNGSTRLARNTQSIHHHDGLGGT